MAVKQKSTRNKMSGNDIIFHIVAIAVFSLIALLCVYPFYYLLICTISDNQAVDLGQVLIWPQGIHFKNYLEIFRVQNLGNAAVVSVVRTVVGLSLIHISRPLRFMHCPRIMMRPKRKRRLPSPSVFAILSRSGAEMNMDIWRRLMPPFNRSKMTNYQRTA